MESLRTHLTKALTVGGHHDRLPFRADCPICSADALAPSPAPESRRTAPRCARTALAAGALALSALAPTAAGAVQAPVDEEGTAQPEAPLRPGEEAPDFDPGAEEPLETEGPDAAPIPGGDEDDDDRGGPLETEPDAGLEGLGETAPPPESAPPPAADPVPLPSPPAPPQPVGPPPSSMPAPPATQPQLPLRERVPRERAPLHLAPIPVPPPGPAAPGGLLRSAGGRQASPPPPAFGLPGPAPLSPAIPDTAERAERPAKAAGQQPDRPRGGGVHVVRRGESLWAIAEELAGPGASNAEIARVVERLWELNRERIGTGDPDLLMAGTELGLPRI